MSENIKKTLLIIGFGLIILASVLRKNYLEKNLYKYSKYTIVEILDSRMKKNFVHYFFAIHEIEYETSGIMLYRKESEGIIGKNVLLVYDSTNIENSKVLIDVEVPYGIVAPKNGWKLSEIPFKIDTMLIKKKLEE